MANEAEMPETGKARGFSDFVVYVDESGDHGMVNIAPSYPVLVLAFLFLEKQNLCPLSSIRPCRITLELERHYVVCSVRLIA